MHPQYSFQRIDLRSDELDPLVAAAEVIFHLAALPEAGRAGDQRYTLADPGKLRRHVGWEPRASLKEGLRHQWEWQETAM